MSRNKNNLVLSVLRMCKRYIDLKQCRIIIITECRQKFYKDFKHIVNCLSYTFIQNTLTSFHYKMRNLINQRILYVIANTKFKKIAIFIQRQTNIYIIQFRFYVFRENCQIAIFVFYIFSRMIYVIFLCGENRNFVDDDNNNNNIIKY